MSKINTRFNYSTEQIHLIGLFHCLQVLIFVKLTSLLYACIYQAALLTLVLTSTRSVLYQRKAVKFGSYIALAYSLNKLVTMDYQSEYK